MEQPTVNIVHAVARRLARLGLRGASRYWRLAERFAPVPAADYVEANIYRGLYERAESKVLDRVLRPGMVCIDVGANIGWYTRRFAAAVGPAGHVHAFEPNPTCLARLASVPSNVTVHPHAVGATDGTASLHGANDPDRTGFGSLIDAGGDTGIEVDVHRLDDVVSGRIDVLKIDVEGWEAEVLAGATSILGERRVRYLLIEVSPEFGSIDYARDLLLLDGYQAWRIGERGGLLARPCLLPPGAMTSQLNLLVVRDDSVAPLRGFIRDR